VGKPRIFLGSSGKQGKLLQALTRGLRDIADVDPWSASFNPGVSTLERLLELTREVDFAVFIFAEDDWTSVAPGTTEDSMAGQASPRDNVVFEAGMFGGVLGMRRTFILHANGAKLPTDLLGLTLVRYSSEASAAEMRTINHKIRAAIEDQGRIARIEGHWWQFSLTARTDKEPSALSLLKISRDRDGTLGIAGRSWKGDGHLTARYWSEAAKQKDDSGLFYYWKGERPLDVNVPQINGTGEIQLESDDRANGYFIVRSDSDPSLNARTAGVYWRADPDEVDILNGRDDQKRAALITERLKEWEAFQNG